MTAIEEIEAQGKLERGQAGWWQVWGASALDIQAGDVVVDSQGPYEVFAVKGKGLTTLALDTSEGDIHVGFQANIRVIRKGTENTLAESI